MYRVNILLCQVALGQCLGGDQRVFPAGYFWVPGDGLNQRTGPEDSPRRCISSVPREGSTRGTWSCREQTKRKGPDKALT